MSIVSSGKEKLFVYGTLADPAVQNRLFGRQIVGSPDLLDGHVLGSVEVEGRRYLNVVPAAGGTVSGRILEVGPDELRAADDYETDAYERKKTVLRSGIEVWIYVSSERMIL